MNKLLKLKPAIEAFHFPKFTKASEVLAAARQIIRDERRWTRHDLAVFYKEDLEHSGEVVASACAARVPKSGKSKATAFCALGAVKFVNGPAERAAVKFLATAAAIDRGTVTLNSKTGKVIPNLGDHPNMDDIFSINDESGHWHVMAMFKLAIKLARKAGN